MRSIRPEDVRKVTKDDVLQAMETIRRSVPTEVGGCMYICVCMCVCVCVCVYVCVCVFRVVCVLITLCSFRGLLYLIAGMKNMA